MVPITRVPPRRLRLNTAARAALMVFPAGSSLGRCTPPLLERVVAPEVLVAAVHAAARLDVAELWLDGVSLVAEFCDATSVSVSVVPGDDHDPVAALTSSCSRCGPSSGCVHAVAALLTAHGFAGVAHRLLPDKAPDLVQ